MGALTFERVLWANRSAAALFRWCSVTVTAAKERDPIPQCNPEPSSELIPTQVTVVTEPATDSAEVGVVEVSGPLVSETYKRQVSPARHFEVLVPSRPYSIATSITLKVILEIMAERPDLSLELVAGQDPVDYEGVNGQLHNVKDYFSSNG